MNIISLPFNVLQGMPPGTAVYTNYLDEENNVKPMLCIKDYKKYIKRLPYAVFTEIRMGVFEVDDVCLIVLLLRLENDEDYTYETWINTETTEGKMFLEVLDYSSDIMLSFYDENTESVRHKKTGLAGLFTSEVLNAVQGLSGWSMSDYDNAREKLYQKFPDVSDIWDACK